MFELLKSPAMKALDAIDRSALSPYYKLVLLLHWQHPRLSRRGLKLLRKNIMLLEQEEGKRNV